MLDISNPDNKWSTSKFHHSEEEAAGQKLLVDLEIDSFLADRGINGSNVALLSTDPTLKIVTAQVADYIVAARVESSKIDHYDDMRQYLEQQISFAALSAFQVSPQVAVEKTPRRSSMRNQSAPPSPSKSVQILAIDEPNLMKNLPLPPRKPSLFQSIDVTSPINYIDRSFDSDLNQDQREVTLRYLRFNDSSSQRALAFTEKTSSNVKSAFRRLSKSVKKIEMPKFELLVSPPLAKPKQAPMLNEAKKLYLKIPTLDSEDVKIVTEKPKVNNNSSNSSDTSDSSAMDSSLDEDSDYSDEESSEIQKVTVPLPVPKALQKPSVVFQKEVQRQKPIYMPKAATISDLEISLDLSEMSEPIKGSVYK